MQAAKINALFGPITRLGTGVSYIISLGYGAFLIANGEMTVGQLVTFNVYLGLAVWPIFAFAELVNVMQQGNASLDRVNAILDYKADIQNRRNPIRVTEPHTIRFDELAFQYPTSQVKNLQEITMSLKKERHLALSEKQVPGKQLYSGSCCGNILLAMDNYQLME